MNFKCRKIAITLIDRGSEGARVYEVPKVTFAVSPPDVA